ncbi:MAG: histidine triad nucleotide-binding protein [Synergistaceae bacterium]|nr:histidine triad nucleotide-binding protein [Synergistaceae bacterium]
MCVFCKIIKGEIPAQIVFENDNVIAFNDVAPQAPTHIVVVPKEHVKNATEVIDSRLWSGFMDVVIQVVSKLDLDKQGYRLVINTGEHGGQTVPHLHLHILAGRNLGWPPG